MRTFYQQKKNPRTRSLVSFLSFLWCTWNINGFSFQWAVSISIAIPTKIFERSVLQREIPATQMCNILIVSSGEKIRWQSVTIGENFIARHCSMVPNNIVGIFFVKLLAMNLPYKAHAMAQFDACGCIVIFCVEREELGAIGVSLFGIDSLYSHIMSSICCRPNTKHTTFCINVQFTHHWCE